MAEQVTVEQAANPTEQAPATVEPSIPDLVQAITYEIDALRASRTRLGWTPWALLAAAGAAVWALLDTVKDRPPVPLVLPWMLGVVLAADALSTVRFALDSGDPAGSASGGRFLPAQNVVRPTVAWFTLLRFVALIWCTHAMCSTLPTLLRLAIYAWLWPAVALLVVVIVLPYFQLPVPVSRANGRPVLLFVWAGLPVPAAFSCILMAAKDMLAHIPACKAGLLIGVLVLIVDALSASTGEPRLLSALSSLRRRVLLRSMPVAVAKNEFEIAIHGIAVSDVVQSYAAGFLDIAESIRNVNAQTLENARQVAATFNQTHGPSPAGRTKARDAVCELCHTSRDASLALIGKYRAGLKRNAWRVSFIANAAGNPNEFGRFIQQLDSALGVMSKESRHAVEQFSSVIASLDPDHRGCTGDVDTRVEAKSCA